MNTPPASAAGTVSRRRYVPAIGPRLRQLLFVVLALFALLSVNSLYLGGITLLEWRSGQTYQDYFYQIMFLVHLALGLLIVLPVILFGILHLRNAWSRPNRRAVYAGLGLYGVALLLLLSGLILTRFEFFEITHPLLRGAAYWAHVITPFVLVWLFVLHRLAGRNIRWQVGLRWAAVGVGFAGVMMVVQSQDPRQWHVSGPASGEKYFFPSLARTASGDFIPARTLMMEEYCAGCHQETAEGWRHSVHRLASFNNPAYLFSVRETREVLYKRDGNLQAARFCAGCHDPAPFFSGAFDDPNFDDVNHPTARAGITCTACHAITHLNSVRGNADYTIEEPLHYPFTFSDNAFLQWVNRQLIRAKPEFHKKTFLKPLHKTAEFCGACHKVHLPQEVNNYKWLRGQNHYDSYLLSGVSGHGVTSFYYPPKATHNCGQCHMPLISARNDLGAKFFDDAGILKVHDHLFPAANTAVPQMVGLTEQGNAARRAFLERVVRVDIFGLKKGGTIDGELVAPLRPAVPVLEPGKRYLLETVIRTLKLGHLFTEGTADSNEIWMDVTLTSGGRVIGRSGGMDARGAVDPWAHFCNAYVLDRDGNRIDRRNAQDIFVPLYNHQIPPGAADVVHYRFQVPESATGPITVEVKLQYRKFDTTYLRHVRGDEFKINDLPIVTLASDRITLGVAPGQDSHPPPYPVQAWERWNDYGIGLLRKGNSGSSKGELRQAEQAFERVETLGRPEGPLNLARVYLKEGRIDEAARALQRAAAHDPPPPPWSVAWFSALVHKQNGNLAAAIDNLRDLVETNFAEARGREFDFSRDYRLLNELGQTLLERAKQQRGASRRAQREALLREAEGWFQRALELDPENAPAHYNLAFVYALAGQPALADKHRMLHLKYRPDDNARDRAVAVHRRANPAADHAAEAVVIYDLQRPGAAGLVPPGESVAQGGGLRTATDDG